MEWILLAVGLILIILIFVAICLAQYPKRSEMIYNLKRRHICYEDRVALRELGYGELIPDSDLFKWNLEKLYGTSIKQLYNLYKNIRRT